MYIKPPNGRSVTRGQRLELVRSMQLKSATRDTLQLAEQVFDQLKPIAMTDSCARAFGVIDDSHLAGLSVMSELIEAALILDFKICHGGEEGAERLSVARDFYLSVAKQNLEVIFSPGHDFWTTYQKRIMPITQDQPGRKQKYMAGAAQFASHIMSCFGGFLVPLDALFDLAGRQHRLQYGLISQAHKRVLTARLAALANVRVDKEALYMSALRLIEPLHLKEMETMIGGFASGSALPNAHRIYTAPA